MAHSLAWGAILSILSFSTLVSCAPRRAQSNQTQNQWDYVIVGGGLTGLVAATRLSENPKVSVLVLEYGPIDRSNVTQIPYYGTTLNTADMRNITSALEPRLGNQTFAVRVGAVAGGGSQVNGMQWDLASEADYDSWELLGNPGWGWKGLHPYIKKSAKFGVPTPEIEAVYNYSYDASAYGAKALAQASFPDFQYPDMYNFIDGLDELGVPFIKEHALGNAVGHFWSPSAINAESKTRSSSLYAYYDTVSHRANLKLLSMHQAVEILFANTKNTNTTDLIASGVKVLDRSTDKTVKFYAKKEVVLAAGAVFTPQLLQLSGIGPKSVLEAAGVETKLDFPAVGSNFQDHAVAFPMWTLNNTFPTPSELSTNATFWDEAYRLYHEELTGPLTKAQASYIAFPSLSTVTDEAETLLTSLEAQESDGYLPEIYSTSPELVAGFTAQRDSLVSHMRSGSIAVVEVPISGAGSSPSALQKPLSRGTIHLNASNPLGVPVVFYNSLSNPFDRSSMYHFIQFTRKLFASDAVAPLNPVEVLPGTQYTTEDDVIEAMIASGWLIPSFSHPSCSCPMMPKEKGGCVDSELKVYGTKKLSIIDASILPIIPAAHLQATMYAVAEKASDIIHSRA
ncbi:choline dehydrogenase [Pseudomassariella vexata]|uniref:Choline dehydrogenase n=1 Tax=Pseudomassariella vexata TaxID=1141098 RepID=A0A1Y2DQR2_9PEZI|nr:choline dehydrogenase [Pseudomassariella vexata]ORY61557.1 choline dehydrogenase [Pseudomassariella vexata]